MHPAEVQRKAGSEPWWTETARDRDLERHRGTQRESQKGEAPHTCARACTHTHTHIHTHTHTHRQYHPSSLHKSGSLRSRSIDWVLFLCQSWWTFPHAVWAPPGSPAQHRTALHTHSRTQQGRQRSQDTLWEMKMVGGDGQRGAGQSRGQGELSGFGSGVGFNLHDLGQASLHLYLSPLPGLSSSHIL